MNNKIRHVQRLNETELAQGIVGGFGPSWHDTYRDSSYIAFGGLPPVLSEGDVLTLFSQYGEPVDLHLLRHPDTGASRGFGFLAYADQRSTILAVDNLNGAPILDRAVLRVDHVREYE
ncbi:hypothetical protein CXG81DRAFT_8407, partial [Caulochytrium protostelioides]